MRLRQPDLWDAALPVAGRSPEARHSSSTGAQHASQHRGTLTVAYVALLEQLGPMSDHEAARLLGKPLATLNSIRNGLGERVRPSGAYETTPWNTKRVKWRLV
jgi:hypothetical protein